MLEKLQSVNPLWVSAVCVVGTIAQAALVYVTAGIFLDVSGSMGSFVEVGLIFLMGVFAVFTIIFAIGVLCFLFYWPFWRPKTS